MFRNVKYIFCKKKHVTVKSCILCIKTNLKSLSFSFRFGEMDSFINNPGFQHIGKKIFKFLDHKSLVSCRKVNRAWKKLVDDPNLWLKRCTQSGEQYLKNLEVHN